MALKLGVLALLEAKPGRELDLWDLLETGRAVVMDEPGTRTWYAFQVDANTFGIFDTFETEEDRQAHLTGAIPAALLENGPNLLAKEPEIRLVDIIAAT